MTFHRIFRVCAALSSVIACSTSAFGGTEKYQLTEHLGLTWNDEVVSYPFSAKEGECLADSIRLSGPKGEVACQLSEIEFWSESKFVKRASLSFPVEELEPLTTQSFTLNYGAKPAAGEFIKNLKSSQKSDHVEAVGSAFAVRLLLGGKSFDPPAAAAKVPAPVAKMRLADGTWFGGGAMFGETPIASYSATILDSGPVFLRTKCVYTYADGNTLSVVTRLDVNGHGLSFETDVKEAQTKDGWDLLLSEGLPAMTFQFPREAASKQSGATQIEKTRWFERPLKDYPAGTVTKLSPWGDWWDEQTQPDIHLKFSDGKRELVLVREQPGRWVQPAEKGERNFGSFNSKAIPLVKEADGRTRLRINNAEGERLWRLQIGNPDEKLTRYGHSHKAPISGPIFKLDIVKDMVLDWPSGEKHPWLLVGPAEIAKIKETNPKQYQSIFYERNVIRLKETLADFGDFDLMRMVGNTAGAYDLLIDSEVISPEERKQLRARMAYLAYYAASPNNWDAARSFKSGNPNMTIAHTLNQGFLACLLKDHPMAKKWAQKPMQKMRIWLDHQVDEDGYWNESSHYARVSVSKLIAFAIMANRAGFGDFLADPKFLKMATLYERLLTPPDPLRTLKSAAGKEEVEPRVSAPHGRGERGDRWGVGGLLAKAFLKRDPTLSAEMQWSWLGSAQSYSMGEGLGGLEQIYSDPDLPVKAPSWGAEKIDRLGYLFRDGTGSGIENFLLFISKFATNPDGEIWPSETGSISKWFARGVPLSTQFNGYPYANLHSYLLNRVMPASSSNSAPAGFTGKASEGQFASLPRLDYASTEYELTGSWSRIFSLPKDFPALPKVSQEGKVPLSWKRQLISVKGEEPWAQGYLVLRDTVSGEQPTQWHFWTLSEKLTSPKQAADRARFLADAPGDQIVASSVLKGDRFTALGRFGMDLEYYIARPSNTPRHTLRYGLKPQAAGVPKFSEYQDLLQLSLPGNGSYFVAMFPRLSNEEVPDFKTSDDGLVISVASKWGVDHVFLSGEPAVSKGQDFSFEGTSASLQLRANGSSILALGAAGKVAAKGYSLRAPFGASLKVEAERLTLDLSGEHEEGEVTISAPGHWKLQDGGAVEMKEVAGKFVLKVPAGAKKVELEIVR